ARPGPAGSRPGRAPRAGGGDRRLGRVGPDRRQRVPVAGHRASHDPAGRPGRRCRRMIRVLLAEDQALVRGAIAALLRLERDLDVVAEVARGDEVVARALETRPDVALLDIEMPGLDGLSVAAQLRSALPACRVIVVTTFGRPGYLRRAIEAGATGFLLKDAPAAQLAEAIRTVAAGRRVVDPSLALDALSEGANPLS